VTAGEDGFHAFAQTQVEPRGWIGSFGLLRQRDRSLCETLEHQAVQIAALDELDRRLDSVA